MSTVTETEPAPPRARKRQSSVLFDAPGPKARMRHNILTLISAIVILAIIYVVIARLDKEGQLQGRLWKPFIKGSTWSDYIFPGIGGTLKAALAGAVLALLFGVVFGLGRMSDHRWIRIPAGAVVEFFRAIPLLILIFFVFSGPPTIANALNREFPQVTAFTALVVSLMLYNGSVLAEIFRAGINAVPRGQSEAAYAIGLRKSGVMRLILIPQATTAMMPAIVSQLVVLLKDSALGWIISYEDLLNTGYRQIPTQYGNLIPAAIVIALIYIAMNLALSYLATWLEKRSRRSRKSSAKPIDASTVPGAGLTGEVSGMSSA
ncbi:amino acid ABC transporter permease [Actinoallomurus rhizosphaericola]|uniref:amino acid ABC transporter permease n=1 Tax=Actinoallomurus rhizosphaericola TaxID=2952536 RepID=UPI002090E5C1|nr:amino acid ABC transporter permease [Actinoallomurus rhizosphaericola]MCO5992392.1 amino acid ABC transporter permease [Actinoallomurus rhizosphaericola]